MASSQEAHIEQVFKNQRGGLLGFIRKRVSRLEDAEDILQDVFFQFVSAYDSIESIDKVSSWLFSVARNKITDRYRKKKPEAWSDLATWYHDFVTFIESAAPEHTNQLRTGTKQQPKPEQADAGNRRSAGA